MRGMLPRRSNFRQRKTTSCIEDYRFVGASPRSTSGNHAIPFLCECGYDGNVAGSTIKARSAPKNRSTLMWKNRSDLAKIVRRLIRQGYDGSEARHTWREVLQPATIE
jgi:hypothetical protein